MAKDYYDILGVSEKASTSDIKKSYRELAKKYHPDANKGDAAAEARFKEISEAYSVLSNEEKRKKYDQMRKYGAFGPGAGGYSNGNFDFRDFGGFGRGQRPQGGIPFEDLFGTESFGLGDILEGLFNRGGRPQGARQNSRNSNGAIHSEVTIAFEKAIKGGPLNISLDSEVVCTDCSGTGAKDGASPRTCPNCNGMGSISMSQGFFSVKRPCPACYGRGTIIDEPCVTCHGTGVVKKRKTLTISIPPGVDDGKILKLKGQGRPAVKGTTAGDLYLKIRVSPHRFFKRKGDNVHCEVPVDIIKAIKGTKIKIKTVYNKRVELKVPPCTKDGRTFKLNGLGVRRKGKSGDMYVKINVITRSDLSDEERELVNDYEGN
ncbi:MAG: molecular chaperone DnaJ [candidate division KSB1 bacterium]|jgi:molecular chaperone DnaJ|nr:molecular chaperone DnaJ [candidate division KSB1 bacterium]